MLDEMLQWDNPLQRIRILLTYPYINFVSQFFSRMRDHENCLEFVGFCSEIINTNKDRLTEKEYEEFDRILISYKLSSLDGLNRWDEYIEFYNKMLNEKKYTCTYVKCRNDEAIYKFIMNEDKYYKYVHFLYSAYHDYEIIKRKQARKDAGKSVEHLKKHQQSQLTEEQLNERYTEMMNLLSWIKKESSK